MTKPRTNRSVWLIIVLSFALTATVLVAGFWEATQALFSQRRWLPGGTVLSLEAVTYGERHRFVYRDWWQKLLYPILPPSFRQRSGCPVQSLSSTAPNALVLWILTRGKPLDFRRTTWVVSDDHGEEHPQFAYCHSLSDTFYLPGETGPYWLEAWELPRFPRRGHEVRLRFYDRSRPNPIAEYAVPNPTPGPHPIWKGQHLPTTRRSGDLEVTLTELTTGLKLGSATVAAAPGEACWSSVAVRLTQRGRPSRQWEAVDASVWDATGNFLRDVSGPDRETEGTRFALWGGLWPDLSDWKLRIECSRTPRAHFTAAEAWTVRGLVVPKRHRITLCHAAAIRQGTQLRLLGIAGRGRIRWPDEEPGDWLTRPTVRVQVSSLRQGYHVALLAIDDRGRRFGGYDPTTFGWSTPPAVDYRFKLNLPRDAKKLDLTVAVHRSRFVEFLAKPSRP
jgi:hypothetical protein